KSEAMPSLKNFPFLVTNNLPSSIYNKCSFKCFSDCSKRYVLKFSPKSEATLSNETPQMVRNPVITYSLYLSVLESDSVSNGTIFSPKDLMYLELFRTFQLR